MKRAFALAATVLLLSSASCAALLGIDAPELVEPAEASTPALDGASDARDAGSDAVAYYAGSCQMEPACNRAPEPSRGFFVDGARGVDSASCGALASPCKTIQAGLARARTEDVPGLAVYVGPGTYRESITLHAGAAVIGGFDVDGDHWTRRCDSAAIESVVVMAPDSASRTVVATDIGGHASLDTLVVRSKEVAAPGESLYGIFATAESTSMCIGNVLVQIAAGGAGASGAGGAPGTPSACDAGTDGGDGVSGEAGAGAQPGAFAPTGWQANGGAAGGDGTNGNSGAFTFVKCPAKSECVTQPTDCQIESASPPICEPTIFAPCPMPAATAIGCGGGGGKGGGAGGGGGSSIALFVYSATIDVFGGALTAGAGGNGADGADGGEGTAGKLGDAGSCMECPDQTGCPGQAVFIAAAEAGVADPGGHGGNGGNGGGGAPGVSCVYYKGRFATVTFKDTQLARGDAGSPGAPNGPAVTIPEECQ